MIAGSVMLASVVEFYSSRFQAPEHLIDSEESLKYYYYFGGVVYRWKLWGAIYLSSAGLALSLFTVLVHFDTLVAPNLWIALFRDGSLAERNWILFLTLFWGAAVHVCTRFVRSFGFTLMLLVAFVHYLVFTHVYYDHVSFKSTLSVGESQANVFFTTWIAFGASALNFRVWRESAGLPSIADKFTTIYDGRRETTYNWIWTGWFSCIFAGAATDMYYNRDEIDIRYRGDPVSLGQKDWIIILGVVWAEVTLCAAAIVFNEFFHKACRLPCTVKRSTGPYHCVFAWRQLEFFVIVVDTAVKFWVILEYAGVDGVIPGLSNAYFGVWGSFFNGVFCLGTWLKENKNIKFFVRDDSDSHSSDNEATRKAQSRSFEEQH